MLFLPALILFALGSIVAFALYGADKARAKRGAWRVPERVLLLTGLLVGAPGALCAMRLLRHKTRHFYFYVVNVLGLLLQLGVLAYLYIVA